MSWTLSSSAAAVAKAGANANATIVADTTKLAKWSDECEGVLNAATLTDWVASYANVGANYKPILDDTISSMVAKRIIWYDMSGFTSRMEATTMLDVLRDEINANIEFLKDPKTRRQMGIQVT